MNIIDRYEAIPGFYNPRTGQSAPVVDDIDFLRDGVEVHSPVYTTQNFKLRVRFSESMYPSGDSLPAFSLTSSSGVNPTVAPSGDWLSSLRQNDTFRTDGFALGQQHVGTLDVNLLSAKSLAQINAVPASGVASFTLQAATLTNLGIYIRENWSNAASGDLILAGDNVNQMRFSLNSGALATDWEPFARQKLGFNWGAPAYGGSSGDGRKLVYVQFKDDVGDTSDWSRFDDIRIDTSGDTVGAVSAVDQDGAAISPSVWQTKNQPIIRWAQPSGSQSPVIGYIVSIDQIPPSGASAVNVAQLDIIASGCGAIASNVPDFVVHCSGGSYYNRASGDFAIITIPSGAVTLDAANGGFQRNDIVYIEKSTNRYRVVSGFASASGEVPALKVDWLPVAKINVLANASGISGDKITDQRNLFNQKDFRGAPLSDGQHTVRVRAVDRADNSGEYRQFDIWVRNAKPNIAEINGWTASNKNIRLNNFEVQASGDTYFVEWSAASGAAPTYYYTTDGVDPTAQDASTTGLNVTFGAQGSGEFVFKVRAVYLGISGETAAFRSYYHSSPVLPQGFLIAY